MPTIRKVCDVISGDIEAPEPLHGTNTRGNGCDVVASHIEHLQTGKESYFCRKRILALGLDCTNIHPA